MKKLGWWIPLFVILSGCSLIAKRDGAQPAPIRKDVPAQSRSEENGPKKRVVLLPLLDQRPNAASKDIRRFLIKDLIKTEQVMVINSDELKLNFESDFKNGEYDLSSIAQKAKALGVASLLEARIVDVKILKKTDEVGVLRQLQTEVKVTVRLRAYSASTGKETFNEEKVLSSADSEMRVAKSLSSDREVEVSPDLVDALIEESFHSLIPRYVSQMEKTNWEGRVALVKGERLFLNVGRLSGLQVGDILKVIDEGEEVFDPETGLLIGKVPGRLKGTLEVVSYFGQDGSVAVIHSGAGFKENDRVEMY